MGRVSKVVNILLKLTPKGFKIQVLANKGYVLNWLWYTKGNKKGLVDLNTIFTKKEGFLKTQAVVLDLLLQEDKETGKRLYLPNKYVIQLNNLFSSIKLFKRL